MIRYPVYKPSLAGNEKRYVTEAFDSGWISSKGEFIQRFEKDAARFLKAHYVTSCTNGTVSLHLALLALGIQAGDEVIVPTFTYIASVNALRYVGAKPVFVDSLPDTLQMNPAEVKRKITHKTKAIMAVHLYGHACDMGALMTIAKEHELFVIEDAAEAFGSTYNGIPLGTIGDIGSFSFFGNKTLTTGEGGLLVSNNQLLIEKCIHYKNQGLASLNPKTQDTQEYWHDVIGYNYRMTNLSAAIGVAQLERAEAILKKKRDIHQWYAEALSDTKGITVFGEAAGVRSSFWMVCILFRTTEQPKKTRSKLTQIGIETRPLFPPVHSMPPYQQLSHGETFSIAEDLYCRGMNVPSYPDLTKSDVTYISEAIKETLQTN